MQTTPPIVLVHGAWQTAGTWDLLTPKLERAGRRVFPVGLTGLEGQDGGLTRDVTLDTHIDDVLRLIDGEGFAGATLVGHSYGGMIITGVAERTRTGIGRLVYVDAFTPQAGESAMQLLPEHIQALFRNQAKADGDGWRLRATERLLDLWGLRPGPAREFVREKMSDFSLACFEQCLPLPAHRAAAVPRMYIASAGEDYPSRAVFAPFADRAKSGGWDYHELPTGHDSHVEDPESLARLLISVAI